MQQDQTDTVPRVKSVSGNDPSEADAAHVGVLFEKEGDEDEIVAIYHAKRAGTLNYVHLIQISRDAGRGDVFMLSLRDPQRPVVGKAILSQQRAARYLRAALEYVQDEAHACSPVERRLIEEVAPSIASLETGTHPCEEAAQ